MNTCTCTLSVQLRWLDAVKWSSLRGSTIVKIILWYQLTRKNECAIDYVCEVAVAYDEVLVLSGNPSNQKFERGSRLKYFHNNSIFSRSISLFAVFSHHIFLVIRVGRYQAGYSIAYSLDTVVQPFFYSYVPFREHLSFIRVSKLARNIKGQWLFTGFDLDLNIVKVPFIITAMKKLGIKVPYVEHDSCVNKRNWSHDNQVIGLGQTIMNAQVHWCSIMAMHVCLGDNDTSLLQPVHRKKF